MKPVFPYPTLFGAVDLEVVSVSMDGRDLPYARISKAERTVALHQAGRAEWDVARIQLKAVLPDQELEDGPWSEVTCLATLSESATNARSSARLARGRDGHWHGTIELVHDRHTDRATLALAVVGEVDGVPSRLIGATDNNWYVDLKSAAPRRQREIRIREVDFREGPEEWLRPFKDSLWIVETAGDVPTVYLNTTGVEGLLEIINGTGGSPMEKLLREMTSSQIAQDAWTAMFNSAISELDLDEDRTPIMPGGWREPVLRMMLPDVLPGRQLTDALFDINDRRASGSGWPELQTSIHYAAAKRSQVTKKLTAAVRSVHQNESGDA
ncbi:hypothetical protein [Amycolatopsis australiensis]|uniref:Uncharacterized protein n=1 Tax=Amycolatopsis australiensis TaxID=546364 RepID=A0A1K1Q593_9PSEU|nr:hypothetical protein [Amycolatopsis australiensis]SFW54885.1 hypothetical protein SAMN04489730_1364 [Amycolatopsis australiensis]